MLVPILLKLSGSSALSVWLPGETPERGGPWPRLVRAARAYLCCNRLGRCRLGFSKDSLGGL